MILLFLDVEATGVDESDRLLQVAYRYEDSLGQASVNKLFKPPVPIKIPAMAVHHVTEKMVADKPVFIGSSEHRELMDMSRRNVVLVAHNAKFDMGMLKKEGVEFPRHICTLKVARYLDDGQFENHQMQYLRYFYGIDVEATAHDAFGDILVLEQVFARLASELAIKENIEAGAVIDRMMEISSQPSLIKKMTFGKFAKQGITSLEEIVRLDRDYLRWLLDEKLKSPEGEEDWIYSLRYWLNK